MPEHEPHMESSVPDEQTLEGLYEADQNAMRTSDSAAVQKHTKLAKDLIARHGWISTEGMNSKAEKGLWLTVLHSDENVEFQQQALEELQSVVEAGKAPKYQLAYLTDRVRRNTSQPQRFGIYPWRLSEDNELEPAPVEDEENIEQRWQEYKLSYHLGSPTFDDYRKTEKERYENYLRKIGRLK